MLLRSAQENLQHTAFGCWFSDATPVHGKNLLQQKGVADIPALLLVTQTAQCGLTHDNKPCPGKAFRPASLLKLLVGLSPTGLHKHS